jgi:hypothetical protein
VSAQLVDGLVRSCAVRAPVLSNKSIEENQAAR